MESHPLKPVRTAVLPVAGLGTRILPATKTIAKEMMPVVDRPVIDYAIAEARAAGIERFVFVTGRGKGAIEDHFDVVPELEDTLAKRGKTAEQAVLAAGLPAAGEAIFTRQQRPLGLGHAVWCARHIVGDEPFAVILPDEISPAMPGCLAELVDAYKTTGGNVVAVEDVPLAQVSSYGVIDTDDRSGFLKIKGLVEKPKPEAAPSTFRIVGRYILQSEIFGLLETQGPGAGNEIQLTDSMARLIGTQPFHGVALKSPIFDCGSKVGFLAANVAVGLMREDIAPGLKAALEGLGWKKA
jgi:UTP--glucose-1-phosphate uridylyltransferase